MVLESLNGFDIKISLKTTLLPLLSETMYSNSDKLLSLCTIYWSVGKLYHTWHPILHMADLLLLWMLQVWYMVQEIWKQ